MHKRVKKSVSIISQDRSYSKEWLDLYSIVIYGHFFLSSKKHFTMQLSGNFVKKAGLVSVAGLFN